MGDKLGDNAQLKLVAASLGLPYEIKRLYPREKYRLGKPRFRASLDHLDPDRSDRLEAPWPDLVITIGRRHAMASLWIKEQSPSTKIVLLGRPRRWIEKFDLVIVPPQYSVPAMPNVLHLSLPLVRSDADAVAKATPAWRARLNSLQKPLIAVFVGGATKPFRFDAAAARELLERCERLRTDYAGTLYFSTSRRTSPDIIRVLREQLPAGAQLYEWRQNGSQNPYLALLEFADYCVVTGDSVSMMLEVADRHKPLAIFELPSVWGGRIWQSLTHRLHAPAGSDSTNRLWRWAGRRLYRAGIVGFARDLTRIHQALFADGLAVRLGAAFRQPSTALADELTPIRERILSMLDVPPP
jgi:mitochondrial fission protein ELM1